MFCYYLTYEINVTHELDHRLIFTSSTLRVNHRRRKPGLSSSIPVHVLRMPQKAGQWLQVEHYHGGNPSRKAAWKTIFRVMLVAGCGWEDMRKSTRILTCCVKSTLWAENQSLYYYKIFGIAFFLFVWCYVYNPPMVLYLVYVVLMALTAKEINYSVRNRCALLTRLIIIPLGRYYETCSRMSACHANEPHVLVLVGTLLRES